MNTNNLIPTTKKYDAWDPSSLFEEEKSSKITDSYSNSNSNTNKLYDSFELKPWKETNDIMIDESYEDIDDNDSLQNDNDDIRDSLEVPFNTNSNSINSLNRSSKKFNDWNPNSIFNGNDNSSSSSSSNRLQNTNRSSTNHTSSNRNSINNGDSIDNSNRIGNRDISHTSSNRNSISNRDSISNHNSSSKRNDNSNHDYYEAKDLAIDDHDDHPDDDSLDGNHNRNNYDNNYNNYDSNYDSNYGNNYNETNIAVTDIQRLVRGHLGRKTANRILLHNERNRLKMKQKMKAKYLEHKDDYKINNNSSITPSGEKEVDVLFLKANRKIIPRVDNFTTEIVVDDYIDDNEKTKERLEEYRSNNNQHINILKLDIGQQQRREYRDSKESSKTSNDNEEEVHYFSMKNNKKNSPTNKYQNYDHEGTYLIRSNPAAAPVRVPEVAPEKSHVTNSYKEDATAKIESKRDNNNGNGNGIKPYGIKDLYAQTPSHLAPSLIPARNEPTHALEIKRRSPIEHDKRSVNNCNQGYQYHNQVDQYHHNDLDPYNKKRRLKRHKAATTIQRVFRGYLGRKRAVARKRLWVDKFKCPNCGRLEQTGVYCKGCGRRIHNTNHDKGHNHNIKKQTPRQEKGLAVNERIQKQKGDDYKEKRVYEPAPIPHKKVTILPDKPERRISAPQSSQPSQPSRSHLSPRPSEVNNNNNLESTITLNSIERKLLDEINALDQKQKLRVMEQKLEKDLYDLNDQLNHHGKAPVRNKESKLKERENNKPKPYEQKKVPTVNKEKLAFGPGAKDFRSNEPPKPIKKKIDNIGSPTSPVIKKVGLKLQKNSIDEQEKELSSPASKGPLGNIPLTSKVNPPLVMSPGYLVSFQKKGTVQNKVKKDKGGANYDNDSRLGSISEN